MERHRQHLAVKIENAMPQLLGVCKKSFLDKFDQPKKDPNVGLYLLGKNKYF